MNNELEVIFYLTSLRLSRIAHADELVFFGKVWSIRGSLCDHFTFWNPPVGTLVLIGNKKFKLSANVDFLKCLVRGI